MASIDLTKLQPGKTYNVSVRALDSDGNYSGYSVVYSFTTPLTDLDGKQLTSKNSAVVTGFYSASSSGSPVGGALTAGGLDTNGLQNAGGLNLASVWNTGSAGYVGNASVTGTASTGAVIINSTGIMGYQFGSASVGQPSFFLNTYDGNAYFRGTIFANAGLIGGWSINPSTLSGSATTTNLIQAYDSSFENQSKYLNYWDTAIYSPAAGTPWAIQVTNIKNAFVGKNYLSTLYGFDSTLDSTNASTMFTMFLKSASAGTRFLIPDLGLTTGASYVFSAYVKLSDIPGYTNNATTATIYVGQYAGNTNVGPGVAGQSGAPAPIRISSSTVTLTASWQRFSASFVALSSSVSIMPFIGSNNPADGSAVKTLSMIDIDAVQLESGTTPTAYNVGNFVNLSSGSTSLSTGLSSSITNFSVTNTGNVQAESINSNGIIIAPNIPFGVSTGMATFTSQSVAAGSFITKTLYFPEGRFSITPVVFTNIMSGGTSMGYFIPRAVSTNVLGTTIRIYNVSASTLTMTNASVSILAVQQGTTATIADTMQ